MTTPKKSARVRRPRNFNDWQGYLSDNRPGFPIVIFSYHYSLKEAKKLHTFLGNAIQYLEGKK